MSYIYINTGSAEPLICAGGRRGLALEGFCRVFPPTAATGPILTSGGWGVAHLQKPGTFA